MPNQLCLCHCIFADIGADWRWRQDWGSCLSFPRAIHSLLAYTRLFGSSWGFACVIQLATEQLTSHPQTNSIMEIGGSSRAVREAAFDPFERSINNAVALLPLADNDTINDGRSPSSMRSGINPPDDRMDRRRNQPTSHTPNQEGEKRRRVATNPPRNPYVNAYTTPYVHIAPTATARSAVRCMIYLGLIVMKV